MATVTATDKSTPACPTKDPAPYERIIIDLEDRPDLKKEVEEAGDLLDYVLCRVPDPADAKYKDDEVRKENYFLHTWKMKYFTTNLPIKYVLKFSLSTRTPTRTIWRRCRPRLTRLNRSPSPTPST